MVTSSRQTKPWWKSKTVWLGVLTVAAAIATALTPAAPIVASSILAGVGAANVLLRIEGK